VFEPLTGAGRLKTQNAPKITNSATADGIMIFIGLKLAAGGGGATGGATGTVTGARRPLETGGASSLILTTVTSSGSSLAGGEEVIGVAGAMRRIVIPEAITRSSISSATSAAVSAKR
jgi:hypothetical protein